MDDNMLTKKEVAARLGVKPATINSRYYARGFPKPDRAILREGRWVSAWHVDTVDGWQAARPGRGRWGR